MSKEILERIMINSPKDKWHELYKVATGEDLTDELIQECLPKPKKKKQETKITIGELLAQYIELTSQVRSLVSNSDNKPKEQIIFELEQLILIHSENIKQSKAWE